MCKKRPGGAESSLGHESGGGGAGGQDPGALVRWLQGQPSSALSWKAGGTPSGLGGSRPTEQVLNPVRCSTDPYWTKCFSALPDGGLKRNQIPTRWHEARHDLLCLGFHVYKMGAMVTLSVAECLNRLMSGGNERDVTALTSAPAFPLSADTIQVTSRR